MLFISGLAGSACTAIAPQIAHVDPPVIDEANKQVPIAKIADHIMLPAPIPKIQLTGEMLYKILLAEIAGSKGRLDIAVSTYLDLARLTRDPRVIARATYIAVYASDYMIAKELAQLWLELDAEHLSAHQILATIALQDGEIEQTLEHLNKFFVDNGRELSPEQKLQKTISLFAGVKGQERVHLKFILQRLIAGYQQDAQVLLTYAQILWRLSSLHEALRVFEQVLALQPENDQATMSYVSVLNQLQRTDDALQWLENVLDQDKDNDNLRIFYARLLTDLQRFDEAQQQFEALLERSPHEPNILSSLGLLYINASKFAEAKACFLALSKQQDHFDDASYYMGRITEEEKDVNVALGWYQGVSASGKHYFETQMRIGRLLGQQNKLNEALEHIQNVQSQNEQQWYLLVQIEAEILIHAKHYDEAMAIYDNALQADDNIDLLYARAMLAEQMDDLVTVERDLLLILAIDSENSRALNALGYTLADKTDRYDEAYELVKKALEVSPNDHHILDSMGWVLYRQGQLEEALKFLNRAFEKKQDPEIAAHLGEVLWIEGDKDAAQAIWDIGLKHAPTYEKLHEVINRLNQ